MALRFPRGTQKLLQSPNCPASPEFRAPLEYPRLQTKAFKPSKPRAVRETKKERLDVGNSNDDIPSPFQSTASKPSKPAAVRARNKLVEVGPSNPSTAPGTTLHTTPTFSRTCMRWNAVIPDKELLVESDGQVVCRPQLTLLRCPAVLADVPLAKGGYFTITIERFVFAGKPKLCFGVMSSNGDVPLSQPASAGLDPGTVAVRLTPTGAFGKKARGYGHVYVAHRVGVLPVGGFTTLDEMRKALVGMSSVGPEIEDVQAGDVFRFELIDEASGTNTLQVALNDNIRFSVRIPPAFNPPFRPYATVPPGTQLRLQGYEPENYDIGRHVQMSPLVSD